MGLSARSEQNSPLPCSSRSSALWQHVELVYLAVGGGGAVSFQAPAARRPRPGEQDAGSAVLVVEEWQRQNCPGSRMFGAGVPTWREEGPGPHAQWLSPPPQPQGRHRLPRPPQQYTKHLCARAAHTGCEGVNAAFLSRPFSPPASFLPLPPS